jgi:hypothetical protein
MVPLLALAFGGCGGGDTETVTVEAPPGSGGTATTAERPIDRTADKRAARAALLRLEDMPTGWHETSSSDDGDDDGGCGPIEEVRKLTTARAVTEDSFADDSDSSFVDHAVLVFADEETAQRSLERIAGDETRSCVRDTFEDRIEEQVQGEDETEIGTATVGRLNAEPLGADTQAFRVSIPYDEYGFEQSVVAEIIATRVDRALSIATLIEPDEEIRSDVASSAARKLGDAVD